MSCGVKLRRREKMELFKISQLRKNSEISEEITETDLVFAATWSYFYGRNKTFGKKLLNLLAQVNDCTISELIENWDRLYKR